MSRLSDLEEVYNELVAIKFNFESLPTTSKYRKYYEWKTDPAKRELPEGAVPLQGARKRVGIQPFGKPFSDDDKYQVKISGRSFTEVKNGNGYGSISTLYGVEESLEGYKNENGFIPAKAIFGKKLDSPVAVAASKNRITGRAYKKRTEKTFTFPFGRVVATSTEFDSQEAIIVQTASTHSVTFKPEILKRR